jgi:predicted GNAT superfamily acetyltransferase
LNVASIRPILSADRAGILRINAGSRPAVAALDLSELDRLLAIGDTHSVALSEDGHIIAYMLAFTYRCVYDGEEFQFFLSRLHEPFLYVDQLAIDPGLKRSGVGSRLYEALAQRARAKGIEWLCCEVNTIPPNPASLDFHRRLGFTTMGNGDTLDGRRVEFLVKKL